MSPDGRSRPPAFLRRGPLAVGAAGLVAYLIALGFALRGADLPPPGPRIVGILVGAFAGVLGSKYLLGQLFRLALARRGHEVTGRSAFAAALVGTATARLLPAGGALAPVTMAWAVRREDDHATGAALRITVLGYGGLLVVTGAAMAVVAASTDESAVLAGLTVPGVGLAVVGVLVLSSSRWLQRLVVLLPERLRSRLVWTELARRATAIEAGLVVTRIALEAGVLWLVLAGLDIDIDPARGLLVFGLASVFRSLPITPGGLGAVEGGTLGVLVAMGHTVDQAAAPVLFYRLIDYWAMAGVGLVVAARLAATESRSHLTDERPDEVR